MNFPAIRDAWRDIKAGFGSDLITLEGKGVSSFNSDQAQADWYGRNGFQAMRAAWSGGAATWSGEAVTIDTSLNHSVVWACNRIISESVGFLPLSLMQETAKGKFPATDHPTYRAVHNAPNAETTSMGFRETRTSHTVLGGNGFAQIERRSGTGTAVGFRGLMPSQVNDDRNARGQLVYIVKEGNAAARTYTVEPDKPQDILHIRGISADGVRGYSVVTMARQSIGTALGAEKFTGRFWANGGRVPYTLKIDNTRKWKSEQEFDKFRADWNKIYSDPHQAPILEPWLTYEKIGLSLADCQLLEARQFSIPEICRWFRISPHLVGDLSRATFANIEQLALEFVMMTLGAWLKRWEEELWRCVLTPEEKTQGYYFRHNLSALLRGDFVSRMAGYASALQNGHLNQDEVRDLEDRNPLPNGEGGHYRVQLNMQPLTEDPAAAYLARQQAKKPAPTGKVQ